MADLPDAPWVSSDLPDAPWAAESALAGNGPTRVTVHPQSALDNALAPITNYPSTYADMNRSAREQMGRGVEQLTGDQSTLWDRAKGLGNVALGGASYASSPISAAYRSVLGQPVENITGIPKEYTEFAASLATPGLGLPRAGTTFGMAKPPPSIAEIKDAASAAYKAPEVAVLKVHPGIMPAIGNNIRAQLESTGFDPLLAPKTFGLLEKSSIVPEGTAFVTADNFDTLRKMLGKAAQSPDKTERAAAAAAIERLDDLVTRIPEGAVLDGDLNAATGALQNARGNWAAASRAGRVQEALGKATRQAESAGFGGNWENATRQRVRDILNSPTKLRGFSPGEKQALEDYVAGNFSRNALRVAVKALGGDNPLMAAIHLGTGFMVNPGAFAAPAAGYALKFLKDNLSSRELAKIDEMLRSRSPLAEQTRNSLAGWARTGAEYTLDPTGGRTTRYFLATRALADRLKSGGLEADVHRLFGPFQGTLPAGAEEDQPQQRAHGGRVNPRNINPNPTEHQKHAGNYAKDHVSIHGMELAIENPKGAARKGIDPSGKAWSVKMPAHYGYIKGSIGADKDHVDVYLGPHSKAPKAFVIDQLHADTGKFDEHKTFLGFGSKTAVVHAYRKAFSDGRAHERMGNIHEMSVADFKRWLELGNTKKPFTRAA